MSYAAFKMMHWPTGIEHCASGFITHSPSDSSPPQIPPAQAEDLDSSEWPTQRRVGPVPNLVVTAANVLEVYLVRIQEDDDRIPRPTGDQHGGGGTMDGLAGARLELVCHYRLHGNVESMAILSLGVDDHNKRRDSIMLAYQDAKITVLEYDDSSHELRTSSMHCFEGPDWLYLKRGRESFARGPVVKADPLGRCSGALIYGLQMIVLKAAQVGQGLVGDDEPTSSGGAVSVRIESSYVINLRDLDMKHVKDFTFVHGYIEPVMVILHEKEPTWAGRISWKHHTCMISALSISTTLKQHPMIWSASNIPHDAYKLLAVPSPIGGVLVICANTIHYHSQSVICSLALNSFATQLESSSEMPKAKFTVELDAANVTWLSPDVAMFSSKTGDLLLLTLIYDGRVVQRLEFMRSKASVLTSGITTIGSSFFFLGSCLGDSLLVQYSTGTSGPTSANGKDEVADTEGDLHLAKRLRRTPSDALQEFASGEELSLYTTTPDSSETAQKFFSFIVRDSLINVGPLKDFSYGLRINADPNATGIAKQSNYELVCCSGHGKNGALCVLQQSIRPELITEVLETADDLGEVTETVDYYVQGNTIAAGNLFGRRRVVQIFARGARILDGSYMTQELTFGVHNSELISNSEAPVVASVSIADPYVLLKMTDGSIQLLVGDPSTCTVSVNVPAIFASSTELISACALYHDKGPEPWLRKTSTDAWLSTGIAEAVDGQDGLYNDQGDIYCLVCYESGTLEIFDVPNFKCVFSVDNFVSGKTHLFDKYAREPSRSSQDIKSKVTEEANGSVKKELPQDMKIVELAMQRWSGQYSRPFLFGILSDGTMLCYHAYLYEGLENTPKIEDAVSPHRSAEMGNVSASRLHNLRFIRVSLDMATREEASNVVSRPRITVFKNVGGYQGLFLSGSRPTWFMVCRERLRVHPQLCDGSIVAFTVLHNVNCNHGLIYVTSQGYLKICQLPAVCNYDNYWPVQKVPLRGTPHQVTYYSEKNLYPLIVSVPVVKPLSQVLSSLVDQDTVHLSDNDSVNLDDLQKIYTVDEFEIRILESGKSGGHWETRATIPMQTSENALTVRVVTLFNTTTRENESLLSVGTAYVQGEDVAARGRMLLYSFGKNTENSQNLVSEVYSKELKGAVSALASLQGHLLVASGPKITLHKWTGTELNGIAFYDAPLHVVSLNIVKNFVLLGDIHKSIYFLNWKEQGAQLSLLAKDFGSLDCYATEFLIDGSTLSLVVSDDDKNIQIFYYAPKTLESWKGQKLLPRAEFHAGTHVTKFLRLQMLSTSFDRTNPAPGSDKTNRFALLFSTLDGSIGCIAPLDELTFRRLQTLQRKLVDAVPHTCGLNPRSFRQFRSNGKAHRPGPDNMVDCELLSQYEMLPLGKQLEIAFQIGTTRSQILSNLNDLSLGTSFL
ncbi:cleavage and polyadenylation specificity factor subunit [Musa troglodytarum]|uniref:Cleavage and polyadenylation specificity factor 160 kDa subunit n=1 Tax=Musa troglodytarum TaxID=320322 RepID=A0A9E7EM32_9LILI|nr:cleavage and polyadenylation specificity factor subunit [Musa troglodytarum]